MKWALAAAVLVLGATSAHSQSGDPDAVQRARARDVRERARKAYYERSWNLEGLPAYRPEAMVSGTIRQVGSNYIGDSHLGKYWEEGFRKYHPEARFVNTLDSTFIAMAGLYTHQADLAPMGRRASWEELMAFQRVFDRLPLEIVMATGSFDVSGWTWALGVFVHRDNPISRLTLKQLDGIFGAMRTGGWQETTWHPEVARSAQDDIRTWGQLGLTGEWKDAPIHVYGYNLNFHFPRFFAEMVFKGGYKWNPDLREYANQARPDGSFLAAGAPMMDDLGKDRYGIAYSGMPFLTAQTKPLALAAREGGPYVELTLENVQNRTYPLTREVYIYLDREPGKPLDPKLKEFLRYVLSRQGQEAVARDGKYLPLTAEVVREQLRKLE